MILDIILNHTGAVHGYDPSRQPNYKADDGSFDPRWDGSPYPVLGFSDKTGQPSIPFRRTDPGQPSTWPDADGAV